MADAAAAAEQNGAPVVGGGAGGGGGAVAAAAEAAAAPAAEEVGGAPAQDHQVPEPRVVLLAAQRSEMKRKLHGVAHWTNFVNLLAEPTDEGHTHQCKKKCGKLFKLSRKPGGGSFFNTPARNHLTKFHPNNAVAKRAKAREKLAAVKKQKDIRDSMRAGGSAQEKRRAAGSDLLVAQLRWFTYARMRVPKSALSDPYFRRIIAASIAYGRAGGRPEDNGIYLTNYALDSYLLAELKLFHAHFRRYLSDVRDYCGGNAYAQGMHDTVTLSNGAKHLALGVAVPSLDLERNWLVCFGFVPCADSTAAAVKDRMCSQFEDVTGLKYIANVFDTVADGAALHCVSAEEVRRCQHGRPVAASLTMHDDAADEEYFIHVTCNVCVCAHVPT